MLSSPLDWALALIGGFWILRGVFRGFVAELASLLGWLLGFILAVRFFKPVVSLLVSFDIPPFVCPVLSFIGVVGLCVLVCRVLGGLVRSIVSKAKLSLLDRLLGGAFGVAKLLILVLMFFAIGRALSPFIAPGWEERSLFFSLVSSHRDLLMGLFDVVEIVPHGGLLPGLHR
jgi:membrane protein required for colicin V production